MSKKCVRPKQNQNLSIHRMCWRRVTQKYLQLLTMYLESGTLSVKMSSAEKCISPYKRQKLMKVIFIQRTYLNTLQKGIVATYMFQLSIIEHLIQ